VQSAVGAAQRLLPGRPERRVSVLERFGAALRQRQRWLLIWLLLVLHLALVAGAETTIGLLCWLVNVGLFVIWQPFIHAERRVDLGGLAVIALLLGCGVAWYGWWLLIVWVVMLAALVGGRVMFIDHRPTRIFYLVAFCLSAGGAALLAGASGGSRCGAARPFAGSRIRLGNALVPAADAAAAGVARQRPGGRRHGRSVLQPVHLSPDCRSRSRQPGFHAAASVGLLRSRAQYPALDRRLLLLIGWTWNTRPGYTGIEVFFSRYLLTIGLPFEQWLHRLTTLASSESDAESFLSQALAEMLDLPWVEGGSWVAGARQGTFGSESLHRHDFPGQPLLLTLHTRHQLSPSLVWHFHLLAQLANEHYIAKVRERELQQVSYLRAIHETGARLTHDVKNLLQSLNNLCYLAQSINDNDDERRNLLLQRQLPQVTQRLQQTLAKLQKPQSEVGGLLPAGMWWRIQEQRYAAASVHFAAVELDPDVLVPTALFDSVTDNLLQNALCKRQTQGAVEVELAIAGDASWLRVCDTGNAVGNEVVDHLLRTPVASESGLGIGLYHAARQAECCGHELRLVSNLSGRVCFELRRRPPDGAAGR
jgi:hypothetical protein